MLQKSPHSPIWIITVNHIAIVIIIIVIVTFIAIVIIATVIIVKKYINRILKLKKFHLISFHITQPTFCKLGSLYS